MISFLNSDTGTAVSEDLVHETHLFLSNLFQQTMPAADLRSMSWVNGTSEGLADMENTCRIYGEKPRLVPLDLSNIRRETGIP